MRALRNALKHGHSSGGKVSREYVAWCSMIQRCHNPNASSYPRYGALGIQVCDEWRTSFESFLNHVGLKPLSTGRSVSIDRINGTGNYEPGNVRWATTWQQSINRKSNRRLTVNGETKTIIEWARIVNRGPKFIRARVVLRGWTPEEALGLAPRRSRTALWAERER